MGGRFVSASTCACVTSNTRTRKSVELLSAARDYREIFHQHPPHDESRQYQDDQMRHPHNVFEMREREVRAHWYLRQI